MRHRLVLALLLFHSALGIRHSAFAQAPTLINYQGRLLNGTNLVNGSVGLSLRLFNQSSGGTKLYEDSNSVTVADGLYSTFIGDHPTNAAFLSALTNAAVWVEAAVNGIALSPRERLASVGYSLATRGWLVTTNGSLTGNPDGLNTIDPSSPQSVVGGGRDNRIGALGPDNVLSGGAGNRIFDDVQGSALAGGISNRIEDLCYYSFLGGGMNNRIIDTAWYTVLAGGESNSINNAAHAVLGGGQSNRIEQGSLAVLAGGAGNRIDFAEAAALGGGLNNRVCVFSEKAVLAGGTGNTISNQSAYSVLGGGRNNRIGALSPDNVLGGGAGNRIFDDAQGSVLAGGIANRIEDVCYYSFLGGGFGNRIIDTAWYAVLAGGESNSINNAYYSFLGGGRNNAVNQGEYGVLAGGDGNTLNFGYAGAIGGGAGNTMGANTVCSTIPGGQSNAVGNQVSHALAAGYRAKANHDGAFVWADRRQADFASTGTNQFLIRAGGGVGINTNAPIQALHVNGDVQVGRPAVWAGSEDNRIINFGDQNFVYIGEVGADDRMALRAGGFHFINGNIGVGVAPTTNRIEVAGGALCTGPAWVNASDRNLKDGFQAVDAESVLARVAALPIATWHYKSEGAAQRHIGPTAQDFHAAFGVGYNDTSIATVDADGVALAAIQALTKENAEQKKAIEELRARLNALEQSR